MNLISLQQVLTWDVAESERPQRSDGDDTVEVLHRDVFPLLVPIARGNVVADLEPTDTICSGSTRFLNKQVNIATVHSLYVYVE